MKFTKKFGIAFGALLLTASLAACKEDTRNTVVPYGSLNLSDVVASSKDGSINLTLGDYYDRLRTQSFDVMTTELKKIFYKNEVEAINELLASTSYDANAGYAKTLSFTDSAISEERYEEIKRNISEAISTSLSTSIYGTSNSENLLAKTEKDIDKSIAKYIDSQAKIGINVAKENITYTIDSEYDLVLVDYTKLPKEIVDSLILSQAENFYSQKELYKIAGLEYLNAGTEDEEKNNYYYFKESSLESTYESSYMTFGTYKTIIITFNSRLEAQNAMEEMKNSLGITEINDSNVEQAYLHLYNNRYSYNGIQTIDSEKFEYNVSLRKNDLEDISSSVYTLVTSTLDNGEYLTQPRNLNDNYVLAYRISTTYDYNDGVDASKKLEYSKLNDTQLAVINDKLKNNIVRTNASNYTATLFKKLIEESELEIYDPFLEYKFNYSYTDQYDLVESSNNDLIFKCKDAELKVNDFYALASKKYASSVVSTYFQQEYAYKFADEFIDEETMETNEETLDAQIKAFEKDNNTTYPKEIGLETYLLAAYGYDNKDDVLKYYYTANSALSSYKGKVLFDEWASEADADGIRTISDEAKKVLNRILDAGNSKYSELFSINTDHVLINFDANGDGTPDDPDKFLATLSDDKKLEFNNAVTALAQAIYKEAMFADYSENSLYETCSYIVKQYNKNAQLLSDPTKTWADYKSEFNFLLTCEQLAASGDITQDSVNNFVVPFADYIRDIYSEVSESNPTIHDNGNFYITNIGTGIISNEADAVNITADSLCKTVYGYHLLILNDFEGPESLEFTEDDDTNDYQSKIEVLINENDTDTDDDNLYVTLNSYNENSDSASLNQLFIYYVESKNGSDSSLDMEIEELLGLLFDEAIGLYSSSNFQTYTLLTTIGITSTDSAIQAAVNAEKNYYANSVISYDSTSEYAQWLELDWTRP